MTWSGMGGGPIRAIRLAKPRVKNRAGAVRMAAVLSENIGSAFGYLPYFVIDEMVWKPTQSAGSK